MTFDEMRKRHPKLGFALYAYAPGEGVTLEILTQYGETRCVEAATEEEAIALAFPPGSELPPAPPSEPVTIPASDPKPSIFD